MSESSSRRASNSPLTEPVEQTGVYVGVTLDVGGTDVALTPQTPVNQISTKGFECALPDDKRITLNVQEGIQGVVNQFVANDPPQIDKSIEAIPIPALKTLAQSLIAAELALEKFHVYYPPLSAADQATLEAAKTDAARKTALENLAAKRGWNYTVGMSLTWPEKQKLFGNLSLSGIYCMVSNEPKYLEEKKIISPSRPPAIPAEIT